MNNGRDCPHGRQVGKCDTCDLIEAEKEIEALKVQVEQLREIVAAVAHIGVDFGFGEYELEPEYIEKSRKRLEATPAQCLAEIKAQAFKQGFEACINAAVKMGMIDADGEFSNQLRQQAKAGE